MIVLAATAPEAGVLRGRWWRPRRGRRGTPRASACGSRRGRAGCRRTGNGSRRGRSAPASPRSTACARRGARPSGSTAGSRRRTAAGSKDRVDRAALAPQRIRPVPHRLLGSARRIRSAARAGSPRRCADTAASRSRAASKTFFRGWGRGGKGSRSDNESPLRQRRLVCRDERRHAGHRFAVRRGGCHRREADRLAPVPQHIRFRSKVTRAPSPAPAGEGGPTQSGRMRAIGG